MTWLQCSLWENHFEHSAVRRQRSKRLKKAGMAHMQWTSERKVTGDKRPHTEVEETEVHQMIALPNIRGPVTESKKEPGKVTLPQPSEYFIDLDRKPTGTGNRSSNRPA